MLFTSSPEPPQVRLRCRTPQCAGLLAVPADNPRDAFCCRGCEKRYYDRRCRVCENLFIAKLPAARFAHAPSAVTLLRPILSDFSAPATLVAQSLTTAQKVPILRALKLAPNRVKGGALSPVRPTSTRSISVPSLPT